jgi:transcriptional regulator with PAS, ATPase and Fis domain
MAQQFRVNDQRTIDSSNFNGAAGVALTAEKLISGNHSLTNMTAAGVAIIDDNLRYVEVNEVLAKMNGLAAKDHIGKTVAEVLPSIAHLVEPACQRVLETGEPLLNIEISGESPRNHNILGHWAISLIPIPGDDGKPSGLGALVFESFGTSDYIGSTGDFVNEQVKPSAVETLMDRIKVLKDVSVALSAAADVLEQARRDGLPTSLNMDNGIDFNEEVRRFEMLLIERALSLSSGNQKRAAKLLRLKHTTLHTKIKKYQIPCLH